MSCIDRNAFQIGRGSKARLELQLLFVASGLAATSGCQVEPPSAASGPLQPALEERYAGLAFCTPNCQPGSGQCTPRCSGQQCAQQLVTGAPDGKSIQLGGNDCQVLDVVFNGGNIAPRSYITDLVLHVGNLDDDTHVRVEASRTGQDFEVVAWINGLRIATRQPADRCSARREGDRILIDLSAGETDAGCGYVETVSHLRFSVDAVKLVGSSIDIDAVEVEPCSFRGLREEIDPACENTINNSPTGGSVDPAATEQTDVGA